MENYSYNPLTQEKCEYPSVLDDRAGIEEFILLNEGKPIVVVQGLGFVGAVMSLVCANAIKEDYAVIGIDLVNEATYWKIKSINDGQFPLIAADPKITEFFESAKSKGNFYATYDKSAYSFADFIIVDINLDVQKSSSINNILESFDVDLTGFKKAITVIGENCKENVTVLVETTVPPGTCVNIVQPILKEVLKKRKIPEDLIKIGHSYERVMPGPDYIDSIRCYPRVYSGVDENSANAVEAFLETIIDTSSCELTRLEHTNATEMAKVLENAYRATNIAFAVEWSRFAEEAGVDLYEIVNAIRVRKTHSNLMFPNIGVGGYCLTKDPVLASWARKTFFGADSDLEMSVNSVSINDQMPVYAYERLKEVFGSVHGNNVVFLGVSYRGDVGDTRFTPVESLVNLVKSDGAKVKLHDPYVSYWQELSCEVESDINKVLVPEPDLVIISTAHSVYKKEAFIDKISLVPPSKVYDAVGLLSNEQIQKLKSKHGVSVLGRGDIN
jgi:UDP-N-acetyl-D-glucosamine dehydrogenase